MIKDGSRRASRKTRGRKERDVGGRQGRKRRQSTSEKREGEDERQGRGHGGEGKGNGVRCAATAVTSETALAAGWAACCTPHTHRTLGDSL